MNPFAWPFRIQFAIGAVACAALLGYALYEQHYAFLDPCPLCILQRIAFMALGGIFLIGAVHGPRSAAVRRVYGASGMVIGLIGAGVAGWHVRLQNMPAEQVPACGPGLEYMLQAFPMREVLIKVFAGSGECADVDWSFLGLSMPAWTLLWFVGLAVFSLAAGWRARSGA